MIVTYLQGGLGNHLFQVAASVGIGEFNGNDWYVQSNLKFKEYFSIPEEKFIGDYPRLPRYTEPRFDYWLDDSFSSPQLQLAGYFQTEKYFKHVQNLIRTLFAAPYKYEEYIKWKYRDILAKETCAIHVRRGDYLKLSEHHYNLELDYYLNAIKALPHLHFVCFSDDIAWCRENIPAHDFIEHKHADRDIIEFHLMSYCKHFIIANSTYSWWASWLSSNKDKIIIAPPKNKWFGPKKASFNVNDLYCDNWIVQ